MVLQPGVVVHPSNCAALVFYHGRHMESSVLQGDCLEIMRELPDSSVDLICTDPPYFGVKGGGSKGRFEWWDRQWEKPSGFLAWMDQLAEQWHRILKPNGSLYCFASPKMAARVEVMLGERFNVLSSITWHKPESPGFDGWKGKTSKESLRQWYPYSERIIFCEHYGADNIAKGEAGYGAKCDELRGFVFEPLRAYLDGERVKAGASYQKCNAVIGKPVKGGGMSTHYFSDPSTLKHPQWALPTLNHYTKLQQAFPGYFTREYEDLRREYEDLRRPFSVTADVPYTDVWTFPTVQAYKGKHPCEKPSDLLEHIISASSRPGAVVLDCFAGSGSTLVAAKKLGRSYIGIEIDPHWASVCRQRLGDFSHQSPTLEERVAWLETQVAAQGRKIKRIEDSGQLNLFNQSS